MSELIMRQCDGCQGIAKEPIWEREGWITIKIEGSGPNAIIYSLGNSYKKIIIHHTLDFCCIGCFEKYLKNSL